MELTTQTYVNMYNEVITRHILKVDDNHTHPLTTRELWYLVTLAMIELGKQLKENP